jgi:hypothetical protein
LPVSFTWVSGPATLAGRTVALTGLGRVTLRASQAGDFNTFPAADVDRSFTVTANFISWQHEHFSVQERANPAISGPTVALGPDGVPNLVKYALGLNPRATVVSGLPVVAMSATEWIYRYERPTSAPDLGYAVEVSTDLATWSPAGVTHQRVSSGAATEIWEGRYPVGAAPQVFFRLRITRP